MAAASQGGGQQADNSLAALWITIGIFTALGFVWHFFSTQIIGVVITVRSFEADLIGFFVPHHWAQSLVRAQDYMNGVRSGEITGVSVQDLLNVSTVVGDYLRIPVILILAGLAYLVYISNATAGYRHTYDMGKLREEEKINWPQITPVVHLDLLKTGIDEGPWAMAQQPMGFAKAHDLLIIEQGAPPTEGVQSKLVPVAKINRDDARKVFAMQLGGYWQGVEKTPPYVRALYACCAARINGDRGSAEKLLAQISKSTEVGRLNFDGVDALIAKYKDHKAIKIIHQSHAFLLTTMASMLEAARQDGVFASADFLWLKPIDRQLWYMLNSVGRQTPYVEVAGPFAHWIVEKEMNRRLNIPMIEEAVNALEIAISEIIYKPEDEEAPAKA